MAGKLASERLAYYEIRLLDPGGRQVNHIELRKPMNHDQAVRRLLKELRQLDPYEYGGYCHRLGFAD